MNKIFKQILQQVKRKHLIIQSGNAVQNCVPISKQDIYPTLNNVQKTIFDPLNITKDMWIVVGSVGKKDISGDIDIALDINKAKETLNLKEDFQIIDVLINQIKNNNLQVVKGHFNSINLAFPINDTDQTVQMDIFLTKDLKYSSFKRFSPSSQESKYKGYMRGILLDSLIQEITLKGEDQNNEEIIIKDRKYPSSTYSHISIDDDQLIRTYKTFMGKKGKLVNTVTRLKKDLLGRDYMTILKEILHMDIKQSDLNSFESIWNNIILNKDFPFKDKINDIKNHVINQLKLKFKNDYQQRIPQELK